MSAIPCSICKMKKPGKYASVYWAWFRTDAQRVAFKLRYCLECASEHLRILSEASLLTPENSNVFACVSCGADASEDSDPVYATLYLPKREQMEFSLQLDGACAAKLRAPISTNGERLPDRSGGVRGPSPSTAAWDALGLAPT